MSKLWISGPGSWAVALVVGAALATPAAAQRMLRPGLYTGEYVCAQGNTTLRLAIEDGGGDRQIGVFDFGGNGDVPSGTYTVLVTRERADTYRLTPLHWVRRPEGYDMVGAELYRRANLLSGTIANTACGGIQLSGPVPAGN